MVLKYISPPPDGQSVFQEVSEPNAKGPIMFEMRRSFPIMVAAALAAVAVSFLTMPGSNSLQSRYFQQTGHTVREPFLSYFLEHGGADVLGFPLTDAYIDSGGSLVQTFQAVHLRLAVGGVETAPIGRALGLDGSTGPYDVAAPFQALYEVQGSAFFGQPISSAREQNGVLVQDFERARLVRDALGDVRLANLGSMYLTAFPPVDEGIQAARRPGAVPGPTANIRPSISVARPIIRQNEAQTIYLIVTDQSGNPVAGAQALAILSFGDATAEVTLPDTNAEGVSQATFITPEAEPGARVLVAVHVLSGETFLTVETTYTTLW